MPIRSYGCLNTNCRAFFYSAAEPLWDKDKKIAAGPPCEVCGARTKWVPGPTQIMRATEGSVPKSKFINQTLDKVVENFNARQELAGLKISDVRPERGSPTIRPQTAPASASVPAQKRLFHDAGGVPWEVSIPIETGNAWPVPVPSQRQKIKQRQLEGPWVPEGERKAAGKARAPQIEAACDRTGRIVKGN